MSFAYPWVLLFALPFMLLPWLKAKPQPAALFPQVAWLKQLHPGWRARLRGPLLGGLSTAVVALTLLAAARPQQVSIINDTRYSRSIVLALDLSGSMRSRDLKSPRGPISRLEGLREVVAEFVQQHPNDRIALVVFGTSAHLQCPLTHDHQLVLSLTAALEVGLAGDATAIGDGLGLALRHIRSVPAASRTIVLVTDGVNNAGTVSPLQAARVAADLGVRVHTIGLGSPEVAAAEPRSRAGAPRRLRYEYDPETLNAIAEMTGGIFQPAPDYESLRRVYREIERLEQSAVEIPELRLVEELFARYAAGALLLYCLYLVLANSVFLKVP